MHTTATVNVHFRPDDRFPRSQVLYIADSDKNCATLDLGPNVTLFIDTPADARVLAEAIIAASVELAKANVRADA